MSSFAARAIAAGRAPTRDLRRPSVRLVTDSEGITRLVVDREPDPGIVAFAIVSPYGGLED